VINCRKSKKRGDKMNNDEPTFKRVMRGYDVEEVKQSFAEMSQVIANQNAANVELKLQINSLREQNSEWENRLKNYEQMETDLRDAVISTQKMARKIQEENEHKTEEILSSAQAEAENILSKAIEDARRIEEENNNLISENQTRLTELENEIKELSAKKEKIWQKVEKASALLVSMQNIIREFAAEEAEEEE
jgi:cell division initiation protein